jgi:hypothetical protein
MKAVNISEYCGEQINTLTTEPMGTLLATRVHLQELEKGSKKVLISIPQGINVIEESFLKGFLGESIFRLDGRFAKKFHFSGNPAVLSTINCYICKQLQRLSYT